ncbi:MAG: hypothetical protein AAF907_15055 [Planctomycetota bacterium]
MPAPPPTQRCAETVTRGAAEGGAVSRMDQQTRQRFGMTGGGAVLRRVVPEEDSEAPQLPPRWAGDDGDEEDEDDLLPTASSAPASCSPEAEANERRTARREAARRRRLRQRIAGAVALGLLTVAVWLNRGPTQPDLSRWRSAVGELDALAQQLDMHMDDPEYAWHGWERGFRQRSAALHTQLDSAPNGSAGGCLAQSLADLDQAVARRSHAGSRLSVDDALCESVRHSREATGLMGMQKFEWVR